MPNPPAADELKPLPAPAPSATRTPIAVREAAQGLSYDRGTIVYHWVTVACVAVLWCIGQTIDYFPKGTPRVAARSAHILLGAVFGAVLVARIVWRIRFGRRLASVSAGALRRVESIGHATLYALLVATVAVGVGNTWVRGDTIVGLFKIPSLAPGATDLRELVEHIHAWLANTLLIVAGLHAALALLHEYVFGNAVMGRMVPPRTGR